MKNSTLTFRSAIAFACIGLGLFPTHAVEPARTGNGAFSEEHFTVLLGPVINYFAPVPNLVTPEEYFRINGMTAQQIDEATWRISPGEYTTLAQAFQLCQDTGHATVNPPIEDVKLEGLAYFQKTGAPYQISQNWTLSTRAQVGPGEAVTIGGISIPGNHPKIVVFRTNGPALSNLGVAAPLADPQLSLIRNNFNVKSDPAANILPFSTIRKNDDWQSNAPGTEALMARLGIAGCDDPKDALIATVLDPGLYAAVLSGKGDDQGVALLEVYILDALDVYPSVPVD